MSIIDYMFSTDDDWANPTIYVLKNKEHECEIEKIHWWDLLRKEVQNAVCCEGDV